MLFDLVVKSHMIGSSHVCVYCLFRGGLLRGSFLSNQEYIKSISGSFQLFFCIICLQ